MVFSNLPLDENVFVCATEYLYISLNIKTPITINFIAAIQFFLKYIYIHYV